MCLSGLNGSLSWFPAFAEGLSLNFTCRFYHGIGLFTWWPLPGPISWCHLNLINSLQLIWRSGTTGTWSSNEFQWFDLMIGHVTSSLSYDHQGSSTIDWDCNRLVQSWIICCSSCISVPGTCRGHCIHWGPAITISRNYHQPTWRTPISVRKDIRCSCKF